MIRSLFKRSGIYLTGLLASKVLSVVVFILFARDLGPAAFGNFVLFNTLILTVTFFADFGLNQWYQKHAHKEDRDKLFLEVIYARLFTLVFSLVLSGAFLFLTHTFSLTISSVFLVTLIFEAFLSIIDGYYLESGKPGKLSLKNGIRMIVYLFGYFIVREQFSFDYSVYLYLLSSVVTLVWLFPWAKLSIPSRFTLKKYFTILRSSSSYAVLIFSSYAYARGDALVVGYALGSTALGIYGAAYRYLESISLIPTALSHNLFPVASRESAVSFKQLTKIVFMMLTGGVLTAILLFFASDWLVLELVGKEYIQAIPILKAFSLVVFFFFINAPIAAVIQSSRFIKEFLPWGIGNTLLNIGLNLLLIPHFGIFAAAWVMLITEVTGFLINLYFVYKLYT